MADRSVIPAAVVRMQQRRASQRPFLGPGPVFPESNPFPQPDPETRGESMISVVKRWLLSKDRAGHPVLASTDATSGDRVIPAADNAETFSKRNFVARGDATLEWFKQHSEEIRDAVEALNAEARDRGETVAATAVPASLGLAFLNVFSVPSKLITSIDITCCGVGAEVVIRRHVSSDEVAALATAASHFELVPKPAAAEPGPSISKP